MAQQWQKLQLGQELSKEKKFEIPTKCEAFQKYFDEVQEDLQSIAGMDELLSGTYLKYNHIIILHNIINFFLGMLSKSRGQVLRVAAVLHLLFHLNEDTPLPDNVTEEAVIAATNLVKVACQQTAFISGRKSLKEEVEKFDRGNRGE